MWNVPGVPNIFQVDQNNFEGAALALFRAQAHENQVYREYLRVLGVDPFRISRLADVPFLPIRFFKTHSVTTGSISGDLFFESSGTTGSVNSRHWVKDPGLYVRSFVSGFRHFYGEPSDWCILGLLPGYLERPHSSLVYMVEELVRLSGHPASGFYLYDHERLAQQLELLSKTGQRVLLIGVTFALLDFAAAFKLSLPGAVVMETGGMKGRREEWTRDQVHAFLMERLGVSAVHSEYGMTELLSQGYSFGDGLFRSVPWMRVLVREEDDPFSIRSFGRGVLNVVDLANVWSCAFIGTEDVGRVEADGGFEVLGRMDNSDVRGCSLMLTL
jgi:hypothetical protein